MKQRIHHYLLRCDGCDKKVVVMHTAEAPIPEGWKEVFEEDGFGAKLDFCPECVAKWKQEHPGQEPR